MISSTNPSDRSQPLGRGVSPEAAKPRVPVGRDQLSTSRAAHLAAELRGQPEIRPEVLARARALAADPSYPPPETIRKVAQQILGSPDLSEEP